MKNAVLDAKHFHNEKAAWAHVEALIWPNGPVCPHCGCQGRIGVLKGKTTRFGLRKCYDCKQPFTVKVGTVFEHSHVPLRKWLQAIHLIASSKKGISSNQLHRTLGVTLKTAWFMSHRIREAMQAGQLGWLGGEGMTVEADETVIGGKERNKRLSKRNPKNIGAVGKQIAFTLVERGGRARSFHVKDVTGKTLAPIMFQHVLPATALMTDDAGQYRPIGKAFASHETVNHGIEEYVRGAAHSNTAEGFFSLFKRGVIGTYHHISGPHVSRYLAEFDFRYSNRVRLGVDDTERAQRIVAGALGRRLTYKRLVA